MILQYQKFGKQYSTFPSPKEKLNLSSWTVNTIDKSQFMPLLVYVQF